MNDERLRAGIGATLLLAGVLAASGARAQTCMVDGDCETGFRCDLPPVACTDREGQAPECAEPGPGECERAPIACADDADCPLGLSCETSERVETCVATPSAQAGAGGDGGSGADGCTTEDVPVEDPQCVFAPVACADDSACGKDFACQALGRTSDCSSEPVACAPGQACQPSEVTCTEKVERFCFPVRRDCQDDGDCQKDWRCAALPEDAQKDPPDGWQGATTICVPEGIALFLEGGVDTARTGGSSADEASVSANDAVRSGGGAGNAAAKDVVHDDNSGCSAAPGSHGGRFGAGGMLLALGLWLARRWGPPARTQV